MAVVFRAGTRHEGSYGDLEVGPLMFRYVLEGDELLLSTDTEEIVLTRSGVTAVRTMTWGMLKSRQ